MLVTEPATLSPWRSGASGRLRLDCICRVPSPDCYRHSGTTTDQESNRQIAFIRRISGGEGGFFPLSERFSAHHHGGGGSSRWSKFMTSPMFLRPSSLFSSSRLRCGVPETLISPDKKQQ
ncbi:unnamed protein product [Linum trigynum]|uniref:Uncharacterized protein n=1 Tax=Linum trigynum TaxID=586398 RepID=A0AAV2EF59_9ROSI